MTTVVSRTNNKAGFFTRFEPSLVSEIGFQTILSEPWEPPLALDRQFPVVRVLFVDVGIGLYKFEREAEALS